MDRVAKFYSYAIAKPTIQAPEDIKDKVKFIDSFLQAGRGVVVSVISQHAARKNRNNSLYLPSKVVTGASSMLSRANGGTAAYDKPVLKNHDDGSAGFLTAPGEGAVLGRAIGNRFVQYDTLITQRQDAARPLKLLLDSTVDKPVSHYLHLIDELNAIGVLNDKTWQGTGHLVVDALIVDPNAVERVLDKRYLTVSTGMTSDAAVCSIKDCHQNWVEEGCCDHMPGHDGMFLIAGNLNYEEAFSFVVNPADEEAVVSDMRLVDLPNGQKYTTTDNKNEDPYELSIRLNDSTDTAPVIEAPVSIPEPVVVSVVPDFSDKSFEDLLKIKDALFTALEVNGKKYIDAVELTEAKVGNKVLSDKVTELSSLIKFLRLEHSDLVQENKLIASERDSYASKFHDALASLTSVAKPKFADAFEDNKKKSIQELENILQEMHNRKIFDTIVIRQDASATSREEFLVENPILQHSDQNSMQSLDKEFKIYIDRYNELLDKHGKQIASQYLNSMKRSGFLPRNIDITKYTTEGV